MDKETQTATVKMAVAGTGATIYGLTLNEMMALVTIIYVLLQIGLLIPKYWELLKTRKWLFGKQDIKSLFKWGRKHDDER